MAGPSGEDLTPRGTKTRGLLAYLALAPQGRADRGRLAGLLWSEGLDSKASLRQAIREARLSLGKVGAVLLSDRLQLALDLSRVSVDVDDLMRRLDSNADDGSTLVEVIRGEVLDDLDDLDPVFDEWLRIERERLHRQITDLLERHLRDREQAGARGAVRQVAEALLCLDPAHEEAHAALIRLHASRGDRAAALRQYDVCKNELAARLDIEPSPAMRALLEKLRAEPTRPPAAASAAIEPDDGPRVGIDIETCDSKQGTCDEGVAVALAAGVREALTRFRWLRVEAMPRSASTDTDHPDDSLRYRVRLGLVAGRERVRVTTELVQVTSSRIRWSQHFDRAYADVLDLVDAISALLASQLDRELRLAEVARTRYKSEEALAAHECVTRAIPLIFRMTSEASDQAQRLLRRALELEPHDGTAHAWLAFCKVLRLGQGWVDDPGRAGDELDWLVRRAIEVDPEDGLVYAMCGHVSSFVRHDYQRGLDCFATSLQLNPHSSYGWALSGLTNCYAGRATEALQHLDQYESMWPFDPHPYFVRAGRAIVLEAAGNHQAAVELALRTLEEKESFGAIYRPLLAGLGHLGRIDEAQIYLDRLRRQGMRLSIGWFRENYPPLLGGGHERYVEGFRKAGVPED